MNAPLLPSLLGYDNPQLIAHGTTALVFRAIQARLNRPVAIKVITIDTGSVPVNAARELATTVALSSQPHIVSIIDTGVTDDERPYIVMEYCEGGSYAQILRHDGPLSVDDVLEVGVKIGEALHAAHQAGIVHRDVKPSNILRSRFGPALTDFGIARAPDELGGTLTRELMTPHHASPEALLHQAQSGISDVYSLASTMWTLLTGHPPFVDPTRPPLDMYAFRDRVLHDRLPPMTRDDVPIWLLGELDRAMSKRPADRHGSALVFAEALRRGALGLSPAPRPVLPPGAAGTRPGPAPARAASFRDPAPATTLPPTTLPHTTLPPNTLPPAALPPAAATPAAHATSLPVTSLPATSLPATSLPATSPFAAVPTRPEYRPPPRTKTVPDQRSGPQTATPGGQAGPAGAPAPVSRTEMSRTEMSRTETQRPETRPEALPDLAEEPGGPDEGGWLGPAPDRRSTPDTNPPGLPAQVFPALSSVGHRRFDEHDLMPPPSNRRGTLLAVLIGAAVLAIAGAAGLVLATQWDLSSAAGPDGADVSASATRFISAQPGGQPRDTRITEDRGTSVTVGWTDPTAATVTFLVVGTGPGGEKLETKSIRRGTTTATYTQLSPKKNYCFVVGAVYAVDTVSLAAEVCTKR